MMISSKRLKCVNQFASPHSRNEVVSLVILVTLLGSATTLILNYSFHQRGSLPPDDTSATILLPDERSFALGEEMSSRVVIVNTAGSDMILEKIEYNVVVYDINNSSRVKEIYASSQTMYLNSSLVIKPYSMKEVELREIWDQRDLDNNVINAGDYLVKIEIKKYNASLTDVISIK
jgi:hypothetical protein